MLTPLVAAAQAVVITPPDQQPPNVETCLEEDITDNMSVLGPKFRKMSSVKERNISDVALAWPRGDTTLSIWSIRTHLLSIPIYLIFLHSERDWVSLNTI